MCSSATSGTAANSSSISGIATLSLPSMVETRRHESSGSLEENTTPVRDSRTASNSASPSIGPSPWMPAFLMLTGSRSAA